MDAVCSSLLICEAPCWLNGSVALATCGSFTIVWWESFDRLLVLGVRNLARIDVKDDWAAAVLLRWEALGEQVRCRLAVGSGKLEVVTRFAPERSDEQDEGRSQKHLHADDDPLSADGEHSEPM
jgi:hypothetical protein